MRFYQFDVIGFYKANIHHCFYHLLYINYKSINNNAPIKLLYEYLRYNNIINIMQYQNNMESTALFDFLIQLVKEHHRTLERPDDKYLLDHSFTGLM